MAGVKFDAHYSVTSVDPPELIQFIKEHYPDVSRDIPHDKDGKPVTMWSLIAKHTIPPTRMARYCCDALKEVNGKGRVVITGVRWAESPRRKALHGVVNITTTSKKLIGKALNEVNGAALNKRGGLIMNDDNDEARRMVEMCFRTKKTMVNPIIDWTDEDVWEFLNDVAKVPHCCLYDPPHNLKRIGCIGCPMAGSKKMLQDFEKYPKYKQAYLKAFEKMIENHPGSIRILDERVDVSDLGAGGGTQLVDLGQQQRSTEMGNPAGESQMPSTSSIGGSGCIVGKGLSATIDGKSFSEWTMEWWLSDRNPAYRDFCCKRKIALADAYHKQKERP